MAFRQFPNSLAGIVCTGGDNKIDLGKITPNENQQLEYYRLQIVKVGLQPTVRMKVNAYVDGDLVATTADVVVRSIETLYTAKPNFYGWIVFTFSPRLNLNASAPTRFELELVNYTYEDDDSLYIAAIKDWPITMGFNSNVGSPGTAPMAIELYGAG